VVFGQSAAGVRPGDRVGITVTDGDMDMVLLERLDGLRA
jgi:hypothetical protein